MVRLLVLHSHSIAATWPPSPVGRRASLGRAMEPWLENNRSRDWARGMGTETELDSALAWTEMSYSLAMPGQWNRMSGLSSGHGGHKTGLLPGGTKLSLLIMNETPGSCRQSFTSTLIPLITTPHPPTCGSTEMLFLWLWKNPISSSNRDNDGS